MNIRLRFPLRRPFHIRDHWPLAGNGAELSFESDGPNVTAFIVTFRDQPADLAPRIDTETADGQPHVHVEGSVEEQGRRLIQKFVDYASLYFSLDVDTDGIDAEYIPGDDSERDKIEIPKLKWSKQRPTSQLPFDLISQAYFAAESPDDPSFVARMLHLAREALLNEHYIDAFRYGFLLLEALYGDGKFKNRHLVQAFLANEFLRQTMEQLVHTLLHDPRDSRSAARSFAKSFPTANMLAEEIVNRRGFYFHGNLSHGAPWHPAKQKEAEPVAEFCVQLVALVAQHHARAMFAADMNARVMANAKKYGAIMAVQVRYDFIDRLNVSRKGTLVINMAGTKATSPLAIHAHKGFLEWAELNLSDATLVSATALDTASGAELFRSQYLSTGNQSK